MKRTLLSWNVNGLRAAAKKGLFGWLAEEKPYLLGVQETKLQADKLTPELSAPAGYQSFWHHAQKKGYSGVAAYASEQPLAHYTGFGIEKFDSEGRVVALEYPRFFFLNIYFP
nr:exodeoxyribonuclease III [Elusimicrobiales bacterium]